MRMNMKLEAPIQRPVPVKTTSKELLKSLIIDQVVSFFATREILQRQLLNKGFSQLFTLVWLRGKKNY